MSAKILIVEDNPDAAKGLAVRLESNGFLVVQSMAAISAMVMVRAEVPDLIILDLGLPDLDGHSFLKELKGLPDTARIPVIVLTARDPWENREYSYEIGAFDFFHKPVAEREL